MMDAIIVNATVIDGVDFYVSEDGSVTGMSQRGLAKMLGLNKNAVDNRVGNLGLKPLPCIVGGRPTGVGRDVNLLDGQSCASLIIYYAFKSDKVSKEVKDRAGYAAEKFIGMGFDSWVKQISGYQEPARTAQGNYDTHFLLQVQEMATQLLNLKGSEEGMPGLAAINSALRNPSQTKGLTPHPSDSSYWKTCTEYAESKGLDLTHSQLCSMGRLAASTFKNLYHTPPKKTQRKTLRSNGEWSYCPRIIYSPKDWHILDNALTGIPNQV